MPSMVKKVRVFLASPGDVVAERNALARVINELNQTIAPDKGLVIELVRWETHCQPAMGHAQGVINEQIGTYDIFVGIMWKRFGSPTGVADSGTEEEFRIAYEAWMTKELPWIMFYFCQAPFMPQIHSEVEQFSRVLSFRSDVQAKGLVWDYPSSIEFADVIRPHLVRIIIDISEGDRNDDRSKSVQPIPPNPKVYFVAGFDENTGKQIRKYLESLGLLVVSLSQQSNQGLTIIEKFEHLIDEIDAAVVILPSEGSSRSRDNIVFELGLLMGRLGRDRLIIMTEGPGVKLPSDLMGALCINYRSNKLEPALEIMRREFHLLDLLK